MKKAIEIANYFLAQMSEECGDTISNLKLQKLCYYAQGFHLAITGQRLFSEEIEAWDHGPVVADLYHQFKSRGAGAIAKPDGVDFSAFNGEEREILDEVYKIFGQFSAWKLRNMTHEEPPWKETPLGTAIPDQAMIDFFKTKLVV